MAGTFVAEQGVVMSRSGRRLAPSFKWGKDVIMSFKAVPWGFIGVASVDPSFVSNVRCKTLSGQERELSGEEREGGAHWKKEEEEKSQERYLRPDGLPGPDVELPAEPCREMHMGTDYATGGGSFTEQGTR